MKTGSGRSGLRRDPRGQSRASVDPKLTGLSLAEARSAGLTQLRSVGPVEPGDSVDEPKRERVMDEPVMRPAQEHEVGELGLSAVGPVPHVMRVAPGRGPAAARKPAAAIAHDHGAPKRRRDHRSSAADIQGLRPTGEHHA